MVHLQRLGSKEERGKNHKYQQSNYLLNHLQLNKCKGASHLPESNSVGRNLKTIFKKSYEPTNYYNAKNAPSWQ